MKEKMLKWICGIIPRYVGNGAVIFVFELFRIAHKVFGKKKYTHEKDDRAVAVEKGLVENQCLLSAIPLGKVDMKYAGCEIVAAYNARLLLFMSGECKKETEAEQLEFGLKDVISSFERDGIVLAARFGVAPGAIRDYFKGLGYCVKMTTKNKLFEQVAISSRVVILTLYNNKFDLREQVHTVCVSKETGGYVAHNLTMDGKATKPYKTLLELIASHNKGNAKGIAIIGIS